MTVAVAMLAGALSAQWLPALPSAALAATVAGLALIGWLFSPRCRPLAALALGLAWACLVGGQAIASRWPASRSGEDVLVEGTVDGLPARAGEVVRFDFLVAASAEPDLAGHRLRLGWYQDAPDIEPGSRWRLTARLKRPHGVSNPGSFDTELYALTRRIAAVGYVRDPASARRLAAGSGIDLWRSRLSARIGERLPGAQARFVQALAVGDTRGLSDGDWETLRATGLTHQIAISGFHVGMVAGLGALLVSLAFRLAPGLGRLSPRPQAAAIGAALAGIAYTALAGFALPTVRTCLMILVVVVARLLRRAQGTNDAFALALLAILAFDPLSVLLPGFWLSFAGVAWLLWCLPRAPEPGVLRPFLAAQGVAVLGLLPLGIWFFGQASLAGPLANLVGIPVISLIVVPLALCGMVLSAVSVHLAGWCWLASAKVMALLWSLLELLASWPAAVLWLPEPSPLGLALAMLAAFWWLLPKGVPGKSLAALLWLPLFLPATPAIAAGSARLTVIDVGQGLSVLIQTRDHALLVDAGPGAGPEREDAEPVVLPVLRSLGVRRLDRMLLSHGDRDHAGGAAAVGRAWPDAQWMAPEGWAPRGSRLCHAGDHWVWEGVEFRLLHPPPWFPYLRNDSSCVLRIEVAGHAALLPGDISRQVERRLLRGASPWLPADWLLVPHHGSSGSSSPAFAAAVEPRWAIVSAGADNRFHLPRPEIVDRYRALGATVLDTADTGMLVFEMNGDGVTWRDCRRCGQRRYWRDRPPPGQAMLSASPRLPGR